LGTRVRRAPVDATRVHGPSTRPVNTGSEYRAPVYTARVFDGPRTRVVCTKRCFLPTRLVDTGVRYTLPVFTARVHGPCTRAVYTGSVYRTL